MKVLMVARVFPAYHPRKGQLTNFVEQIINDLHKGKTARERMEAIVSDMRPLINDFYMLDGALKKLHTLRAGSRWKAGDMASLRVWSDKPYRSKQIEFAQVQVKSVYPVDIYFTGGEMRVMIDGNIYNNRDILAKNDGLELADFIGWFQKPMDGQMICWGNVKY